MLKQLSVALAGLFAAAAFAATDVNKATQAELEALKGVGPISASLIMAERKNGNFKSWDDLITRVKGVGETSAQKYSDAGLTVNGASYKMTGTKPSMGERAGDSVKGAGSAIAGGAVKTGQAMKEQAKTTGQTAKEEAGAAKQTAKEGTARVTGRAASDPMKK